jgi:hypothetical protein
VKSHYLSQLHALLWWYMIGVSKPEGVLMEAITYDYSPALAFEQEVSR